MIRVNLTPTEKRRGAPLQFRLPSANLGLLVGVVYAAAVLLAGVYWGHLRTQEARLQNDIARDQRELETLKPIIAPLVEVKARAKELKQRVDTLQALTKGQERAIALLDAFVDTVPRDLWITGFEDKGNALKLTGAAYSTTAVADFMSNLRQSGKFKEVDITVARQDLTKIPRLVTFEVTCKFES